jgi:hypothetical protein
MQFWHQNHKGTEVKLYYSQNNTVCDTYVFRCRLQVLTDKGNWSTRELVCVCGGGGGAGKQLVLPTHVELN